MAPSPTPQPNPCHAPPASQPTSFQAPPDHPTPDKQARDSCLSDEEPFRAKRPMPEHGTLEAPLAPLSRLDLNTLSSDSSDSFQAQLR
ncbi:hypothetical protein B296_00005581 [Ensete ventricosum]|uniref:Uncharacterized protein n=1 Tax=Ensete ventricosum TaxID=4639 RepID=A0A427BC78_ENSVE|nr:hypothetical protein B296_00005581 [Ensete ventricosum]